MKLNKFLFAFFIILIFSLVFFIFSILLFMPTNTVGNSVPKIQNKSNNQIKNDENLNYKIINISKKHKATESYLKYPKFENDALNKNLYSHIQKIISDFESEYQHYEKDTQLKSPKLKLETDIGFFKDNIVSIRFFINRNYLGYPNPVKFYECYLFDLNTGNEINVFDLFEDYSYFLYNKSTEYFKNNYGISINKKSENYYDIAPKMENYTKIFIKNDFFEFLIFDYKKNEDVILRLKLEEINPFLKKIQQTKNTQDLTTFPKTIDDNKNNKFEQLQTTQQITEQTTQQTENPYNIDSNKPMIALTFDDGPNGKITNKILDILEENNSRATFFVVGRRLDKDAEVLKRMDKLGNQIGNHTFNHKNLAQLSKEQITFEIEKINEKLQNYIGKKSQIVRIPYGATNEVVLESVPYPIILWNVDTRDWESRNTDSIIKEIRKKAKDGSIILMHDLYETTAKACEIIIPELVKQGYQLVTIDELMKYRGIELKSGIKYYNATKK